MTPPQCSNQRLFNPLLPLFIFLYCHHFPTDLALCFWKCFSVRSVPHHPKVDECGSANRESNFNASATFAMFCDLVTAALVL